MPRTDLILILDGEMTGNLDDDELIEIGVVALREPDWDEVGYFQGVIKPQPENLARMLTHPVVGPMLENNGLVRDLENGSTAESIDDGLIEWLRGFTPSKYKTTHVPYGGSGVSHFDRKYLEKALPRFCQRITHWAHDTGDARRWYELAGVPWDDAAYESKTHRALDDARAHAMELRYVVKSLRDWYNASQGGLF